MIATVLVLTAVAVFTPQLLKGIRVKDISTALVVAALFVVLNLLIGWLLKGLLSLFVWPLVWLTFGLASILVTSTVNAVLLKVTANLIEPFDIDGWLPAFGMGFLFALGGQVAKILT
ncbi:MAG: phage holin family protein [Acidobacteriota bacterium]